MLYYEKGAKETRGIPKKATEAALSAVVLQWHSCAGGGGGTSVSAGLSNSAFP